MPSRKAHERERANNDHRDNGKETAGNETRTDRLWGFPHIRNENINTFKIT